MLRAAAALGYQAEIIDLPRFANELKTDREALFLCVDSGEPINFNDDIFCDLSLERVGYWLIDFRHHKEGPRNPSDIEICKELNTRGGWIFQAQREDLEFSLKMNWQRSRHLPLAADPEIWSDVPVQSKIYHLAFAGNIWDRGRASVLESVFRIPGIKFGFPGHGVLWMEDAAKLIRSSQIGFNVNSWFGSEYAFDLNMRFYETLSCGVPIITNHISEIDRLFPNGASFVATYRSLEELPALIHRKLNDRDFLASGSAAKDWILDNATYKHRVKQALKTLQGTP